MNTNPPGQLNTSEIATNSSIESILSSAGVNTGSSVVDAALDRLNTSTVNDLINTAAHSLGLHDYYYAHVATWCEGVATGSNSSSASTPDGVTITNCTSPAYPFSFNPVSILETELLQGVTLDQLGFPSADVNRVVSALETAYRAMSLCYLIGTLAAAVSVLTGLLGFMASRLVEMLNQLVAVLAMLFLGAGSAIATVIALKVRDVINDKAAVINVSADNSTTFLAMTWAAVAAAFLVCCLWCCVCCCGDHGSSRRNRRHHNQRESVEQPLYPGEMAEKQRRQSLFDRFRPRRG